MTDPRGHLDLDELADVLAGERDDAHLRACAACTDRLADLTAAGATVSAALGALPPPVVPEGLPARLASALEAERRREADVVRPLRRRRPPSWLPAVAASAALVMTGAVGWSLLTPGQGQDASTSAASGGSAESDAGAGSETAVEAAPEAADSTAPEADSTAPEVASGLSVPAARAPTDWADPAQQPVALSRLLEPADPSADTAAAVPSGDALDRLRDPAALAACVGALPGGGDVLAVDYAGWAGAPAVAVVRPGPAGSVTVTVVGAGCSAQDPAVLSTVVLPRP